ncbi:MFS transporter [Dongshaea marina]|uniref:MFS transporter n=1 Tax=Dongshaea marina TaxID=2047966 RepID=UPI000D3E708E|nr:MFS transporter [Dongshaea marina]
MQDRFLNSWKLYTSLPRDIYLVALARLVIAAGAFIFPFLGLILTQKLLLSPALAGVLVAVASFSFLPGAMLGGKLADKHGRKWVMLAAMLLTGFCIGICGFFAQTLFIIPSVLIGCFAMGAIRPCTNAMLIDLAGPERRETAISLGYLAVNLGFAMGPVIAGYLFAHHLPWMFWGDGMMTLFAMSLVLLFVRHNQLCQESASSDDSPRQELAVEGSLWRVLCQRPYLIWFTLYSMLLTFGFSQLVFALPLYTQSLYGDTGAHLYGQLMTENAIIVVCCTPILIALFKRVSEALSLSVSGLLLAAGFILLALWHHSYSLWGAVALMSVAEILIVIKSSLYFANHSPSSHRARICGVLPMVMMAGEYLSPPLVVGVIEHYGFTVAWWMTGAIALLGAGLLWQLAWRDTTSSKTLTLSRGDRFA